MIIEKGKYFYKVEVNQYLIVDIQHIKITKEIIPGRFKYKVIEQTTNRDYEIPETEEERLKKKYGRGIGFDYNNGRDKIGNTIGGESSFKEEDLVEELTNDYILEKVNIRREQIERGLKNALRCPLTGGRLVCLGTDSGVMDGNMYWIVEGHEDMRWETGTRWFHDIFSGHGYYKWYSEEKEWREQIKICDGWKFVDKPKTPEQEEAIQKIIQEYEEKERIRKEEYERKVASGEITLLPSFNVKRVYSKTISLDKVEVRPMSPPSGMLFYADFKINGDDNDSDDDE